MAKKPKEKKKELSLKEKIELILAIISTLAIVIQTIIAIIK